MANINSYKPEWEGCGTTLSALIISGVMLNGLLYILALWAHVFRRITNDLIHDVKVLFEGVTMLPFLDLNL